MTSSHPGGFSRRAMLSTFGAAAALTATSCTAHPSATKQASPQGAPPPEPYMLSGDADGYRMKLILFGTAAGPLYVPSRSGMASGIAIGDRTYVVDAGPSAARRLGMAGIHPDALSAVFVTHLHNDHLADLFNLFWLANPGNSYGHFTHTIPVYGPGSAGRLPRSFDEESVPIIAPDDPVPGTEDMWAGLLHAYAYEINIRNIEQGAPVDYHELNAVHDVRPPDKAGATPENTAPDMEPFPVYEDDRTRVSALLVPHGPVFPSFAYRFDSDEGSVTFSGDTARSTNVARLASDTDILVHEVIDVDYYAQALGGEGLIEHMTQAHTTPADVGRVATDAAAKSVVLSHIGPGDPRIIPDEQWEKSVAQTYGGTIVAGNDLTLHGVGKRA